MKKIAIVGGGAAGIFLGHLLSDLQVQVNIYEKDDKPLKKVLATGNGRCNFTNDYLSISDYQVEDEYKDGVAAILEAFDNRAMTALFDDLGMPSFSMESGRRYPNTLYSKTPVACLLNNIGKNINVIGSCEVKRIQDQDGAFRLETSRGSDHADIVVICTGGRMGIRKNDFSNGYDLAKALGHRKTELFPGIVALKTKKTYPKMKNIKVKAKADLVVGGKVISSIKDDVMFTDVGVSGLAILQLSNLALWELGKGKKVGVKLDLLPELEKEKIEDFIKEKAKRSPRFTVFQVLEGFLQEKIIEGLLADLGISKGLWIMKLREDEISKIADRIKAFDLDVLGPKSFEDGQITCGGIDLAGIDLKSLESKGHKNLYFCGEVLDVQGESGGYNLQWAWSSAHRVFESIKKSVE